MPGVSPDQHGQHAALRRDLGRAGQRHLGGQPAQLLQQLHRRRRVRQRRRGRAQRHPAGRRLGRAVPGDHLRRAGRAGPRARRLRERRHPQRRQRAARLGLRVPPRRRPERRQPPARPRRCRCARTSTGSAWAAPSSATGRSSSRTSSSATSTSRGSPPSRTANVDAINARLAATGYPGSRDRHRRLSEPGAQHARPRQARSPGGRPPDEPALQPLPGDRGQLARRGRAQRAQRLGRPRQRRPRGLVQRHLGAVAAARSTRPASSSPTATWRRRRPIPSARRSASRASRPSARSPAARRGAPTQLFEVVDTLSHQAGAHALRAGVDFLYNDTTITYPRSVRGSYTFSSLANFLAGTYNNAGFTPDLRRSRWWPRRTPTSGSSSQDEWHAGSPADPERRPALRPAVPGDDRHRHRQRLAARRLRLDAVGLAAHGGPRQRGALLRPRARCARWPTPSSPPATRPTSSRLQQTNVSLSPDAGGGAALPGHPARRRCRR